MSLACLPDFALPALDVDRVPFHADPVLAAIERHEEAWSVFQVAPDGEASERAETEMGEALAVLLTTPCATRFGAFALLRHLSWWLREEAETADAYAPAYGLAQARAADLALLLNVAAIEPRADVVPLGRLSAQTVRGLRSHGTGSAASAPGLSLVAGLRFTGPMGRAGELLAALVVIVGGLALSGFATLL